MVKKTRKETNEERNRPAEWDTDGVRSIWSSVSLRAIRDYKAAKTRRDSKARHIIEECEAFFDSDAFGYLTNGLGSADVKALVEKEMEDAGTHHRNTDRTMAV